MIGDVMWFVGVILLVFGICTNTPWSAVVGLLFMILF